MMNTSLIKLNKPSYTDKADVAKLNENFDLIDSWLQENVIQRHDDMFNDFVLTGLQPVTTTGVVIENCDELWDEITPSAGVTVVTDTFDFKMGTGSLKILMEDIAPVGVLAAKAISPIDLTNSSSVKLWVKSNIFTNEGDFSLLLSKNAKTQNPVKVLPFPALVANTWTLIELPLGDNTLLTDIISIGIRMNVDKGNCSLWVDYITGVDLDTTIVGGIAYVNGYRIEKANEIVSFSPSKETYVYIDKTGTYVFRETSIGGNPPVTPPNSIPLARVITSTYNVSNIIDIRNMSAVAVSPTLSDGQVTESKLANDSVSTSKIKNSAITSVKIALDAIYEQHVKDQQITNRKIRDGDISLGNGTDNSVAGKLDAEFHTFTVRTYDSYHPEEVISHNLGRVPVGYIVVRANKPVKIYDGNSLWTNTHIYLKGDNPNTQVTVMIF